MWEFSPSAVCVRR